MSTTEEIVKSILAIPDQRYFEDTETLLLDMELALADSEFKGIAINAPRRVAVKTQEQLPILMAIQQSGLEAWRIPTAQNCVLAAMDMNARTVYFGQVFRDPKAETFSIPIDAPPPPAPEGVSSSALISGLDRIDARTILTLPWQTGRYRLTVMVFDSLSNTVEVVLEGESPASPATAPPVSLPAAPGTGRAMPTFLSPPAAARTGGGGNAGPRVQWSIAVNPEPGVKLAVSGAFSILAESFHVLGSPIELLEVNAKKQSAVAVVPVTLAIIGKNWPVPRRFDWAVPVYMPAVVRPGDPLEGFFAVDAFAGAGPGLAAGDYAAYLMVEGHLFGPQRFSVTP